MQHMWQPKFWGALTLKKAAFAAVAVLVTSGCSGSDAEAPAAADPTDTEQTPDGAATDEAGFELAIDGREESLGALARLEVLQGVDSVHLAISGADRGSNFVLFDIQFATIEGTMGSHVIDFGLPDQVENHANVSLDGEFYYSQSGQVEVTLLEDGRIEGRFNVSLAPDDTMPGSAAVALEPSENPTTLTGSFSGEWILSCHSRLAGHEALVVGGEFCETLEF